MLAVLEMIEEENKRIFQEGKREGKKETAKRLLVEGISIDIIMKVTGLKEKEIRKLAN